MWRIVVILLINVLSFGENSFYEDYCWRDYDEIVPSDALVGGIDNKGNPIFIGQAIYDNKLLPGKILTNDKNCYIMYGEEEHAVNESVQILCSSNPDKFEWYPVNYNHIKDGIKNKRPLEAGYERGAKTYIGRVHTDTLQTVSKVTCWSTDCEKLSIIYNGVKMEFDNFNLLVYDLEYVEKE